MATRKPIFSVREIALYGVMVGLALVLGYVESMFPIPFAPPGVKLGLGNVVVLFALYVMGWKAALFMMIVKVIASSILFGNPTIFMYSAAGGVLSYLAMVAAHKLGKLSVIGVSVSGSVFHIVGQLIVVSIILNYMVAVASAPLLLVSSVIAGVITGKITQLTIKSSPRVFGTPKTHERVPDQEESS